MLMEVVADVAVEVLGLAQGDIEDPPHFGCCPLLAAGYGRSLKRRCP